MTKHRAPRRTFKLVRYLESVLVDPKASAAMKQVASGRLTELFLADSAAKARKEIAIARAEARLEIASLEKTAESTSVSSEGSQQPDPHADTVADGLNRMTEFMSTFTK